MKEVRFRVTDQVHKGLRRMSNNTGYSMSWCARHAVTHYLKKKGLIDDVKENR